MKYPELKQSVVDGVCGLAIEYSLSFDAFALNTDEDGWSLYHTAAVADELNSDDLTRYFSPNEWSSDGSTVHLDPANEILVGIRDSISIEDLFETLASSLLRCRILLPNQLAQNAWMTVASNDPSQMTADLELRWAKELNSEAMYSRFVDWTATVEPLI